MQPDKDVLLRFVCLSGYNMPGVASQIFKNDQQLQMWIKMQEETFPTREVLEYDFIEFARFVRRTCQLAAIIAFRKQLLWWRLLKTVRKQNTSNVR